MKRQIFFAVALSGAAAGFGTVYSRSADTPPDLASPIYGVTLPEGYRDWKFIAPAQEAPPLDELRAVLANDVAVDAYKSGTLPFPDGSILVKLAYKRQQSTEFAPATVPGAATTVQVMVKDSKKYAASHGWGFGRFVNGKPVDAAQHETCLSCHEGNVKDHDFVFTRYAP
ncbi:cytochrome P460 family protein [Agrobacterium tumefaciens]|uniref:cytochrome P460 family protein n=1 Tax=Agrobacterium tumefaciens TaxID=358 RepID=UPI001573B36C|nr:cytochrome P460 family protein [Agrobacterium tumefaciens]NSZ64240.1 cytochrome P460 family protein [Agrobacterium tumefaciens]NTA70610.1 cytochrome P460 family protein [Agrobacterium tumefaciens]WIE41122.1 cytochrome P460 family protein [Agrobacterium tumefaciens]